MCDKIPACDEVGDFEETPAVEDFPMICARGSLR